MSKFSPILQALGLGALKVNIPAPVIPAAPAAATRTDSGANVVIGSDAVKDQRVSGSGTKKKATADIMSGLGAGSGVRI